MPWRKLKEELTCPICLELFSLPRRLPCGHSYCHSCIQVMLEKRAEQTGHYYNRYRALVCPECREELSFDYVRGIEGIPTDFKLSKLVELFHFIKAKDDSDSCEETKSSSLGSSTTGFQVASSSAVSPGAVPGDHSTSGTVCEAELPLTPTPAALATLPVASPDSASCVPCFDEQVSDSTLGAVGGIAQIGSTADESPDVITKHQRAKNPINCGDFLVQHSNSPSPCFREEITETVLSQHSNILNPSSRDQDVSLGAKKLPNTVKAKRSKKSSWKSLFVSDSSSTDSSDSDSHRRQGSHGSSGLKNKHWLMTRFLKSVIFSDSSSSSEDSDDPGLRRANTRGSSALPPYSGAGPVSDSTGNLTDHIESTNVSNVNSSSQQENNACNATVALTESIVSSQSSATLVKEPVVRIIPVDSTLPKQEAISTRRFFIGTDCDSTTQPAGNQQTLYDNLHSHLGQERLLSTYDNADIRVFTRAYPNIANNVSLGRPVQEVSLVNRFSETHLESGPRTHYDNIGDCYLQQVDNSTRTHSFNEIENLKTGFEHIPDSLFCTQSTSQSVTSASLPNTEESNLNACQNSGLNQQVREGVCLPEGFGELAGSPPASERLMSPYDNLNRQETSSSGRLNMSQDHPASPTMVLTTPETEAEPGPGIEQFSHVYGQVVRTDNDFEFDDNYFDTSSEEVSERDLSHLNLAPSSFALDLSGDTTLSRSASAGPLARASADASDTKKSPTTKSLGNEGKEGSSSEEEDDGSHSGTSMLHNKKKPRSRLKKFLTSLLSLSSSDDEDEHFDVRTSSSSKSSDW